jgi:hypothetical protein
MPFEEQNEKREKECAKIHSCCRRNPYVLAHICEKVRKQDSFTAIALAPTVASACWCSCVFSPLAATKSEACNEYAKRWTRNLTGHELV